MTPRVRRFDETPNGSRASGTERSDVALILAAWNTDKRVPALRRVADVLVACYPDEAIGQDTLGGHNLRMLRLHNRIFFTPIEAQVLCHACQTENAFTLPIEAMARIAPIGSGVIVTIGEEPSAATFRLPVMDDIAAAAIAGGDLRIAIVQRCRLDSGPPLIDADLALLQAEFERLDPMANIIVETACVECSNPIAATVELADFIARDMDGMIDGLLRDIDVIAGAYGWSEGEIVALPQHRRAHYVAMIVARRTPSRPSLAELAG